MKKFRFPKIARVSAIVFVILISVYFFFELNKKNSVKIDPNNTYVHFVDVGQGDCAIIQSPGGNILIDSGTVDSIDDVVDYIDELGINSFEYVIFTHPHSDHIGGAVTVLNRYDVSAVVLPNAVSTGIFYERMLDAIENNNCKIIKGKEGVSFDLAKKCKVELFAPGKNFIPQEDDLNNASIVAKVTIGDVSFLFTGDAEEALEGYMLRRYSDDLDADILKVGHHGSSTSSTRAFINAVSPEIGIVSAGEDNEYGHPHREVVSLFNEKSIKMYITYEVGSIVVETDGKTYKVITEKKPNDSRSFSSFLKQF